MKKEFLNCETVRDNTIKLCHLMYKEGYIPDIILCSLRGGAFMANVISEYYKIIAKDAPIKYEAVIAHSYTGIRTSGEVIIDGWTIKEEDLNPECKIMLVDDIYDTGLTIDTLCRVLLAKGIKRDNLKIVVHDYKEVLYRKNKPNLPDYYCRKHIIENEDDEIWIHYMSHELMGLKKSEIEANYKDKEVVKILKDIIK